MDQLLQCPVCTLYLHNGMSLESHLDTHPKDQVIKALCSLSSSRSSYGSRASTPMNSERSYRSRSRTPATEDSGTRWNNPSINNDHERFWRRTPSRNLKTSTITRSDTPDHRIDSNFDTSMHKSSVYSHHTYSPRSEKNPTPFVTMPVIGYEQPYPYFQEPNEEKEIKYSRSAEYTPLNTTSSVYAYNLHGSSSCMKIQNTLLPTTTNNRNDIVNLVTPNKKQDYIKILPKSNNIALLKTNVGPVQYLAPGVMVSSGTFVQNNPSNNLLMTNNLQNPIVQSKSIATPISSTQFSQLTSGTFAPNTTVVTQKNSQIIYSEMIHSINGKRILAGAPTVQEKVTNVAQSSSVYQNVMVVDQFGNTSCMYTTPQQILPKPAKPTVYKKNISPLDKAVEKNKTLIIEVSPIVPPGTSADVCDASTNTSIPRPEPIIQEDNRESTETPGSCKGLKILSNIKVEVPVQHHKNLLNTVVDLTGPNDCTYNSTHRPKSPDRILPDLEVTITDNNHISHTPICSNETAIQNTFSVIKNVGNPPTYKESKIDSKIHETESSDSCPVPDLICNEKPSISPCSELSDNGDNATSHEPITPKVEPSHEMVEIKREAVPVRTYRNNPLRLNNIYVRKNKKILQIKNAKTFPVASTSACEESSIRSASPHASPRPSPRTSPRASTRTSPRASTRNSPRASTGTSPRALIGASSRASPRASPRSPEDFSITKMCTDKPDEEPRTGRLETVSINKIQNDQNDFDADTEEQSMDMELEPVAPSSYDASQKLATSIDLTQVKEEVNSSNDFSNQEVASEREFSEFGSMRPLNVVEYGNMPADFDDESNHRELLDLEAASKNKQFVSMMNDNYFGDNIYADYFTPDRVESFDAVRESTAFGKEGQKDYLWGESSQKDSEFVLPNFIHESYKIAESAGYGLGSGAMEQDDGEGCGEGEGCGDSKGDVLSEGDGEPVLNICTDEMMPPRGELSGQESNGDMDTPWSNGMYQDTTPSEPYDLIARESWIDEGSDIDSNEKRECLEEELTKPRPHECLLCGLQFPLMKELRAHRAASHPPPSGSNVDSKTYSRLLIKNRLIKKEEKTDEVLAGILDSKPDITSTVLEAFEGLEESKPKIEIKQETKRRRRDYVCPTCKIDQLTDVAFHEHLKIHPLECLTCGKCFFRRANLALHIKTHLGIKNYKCEVCEKRFLTRQKLVEHHNVHTGRAPIKCTHCDHTFRRYSNMVQHRDRHHMNKKPKIRDFVCHCGEVFHSRAKLRWHKETHDGKPKACHYCSDKFLHMSSLTRHMRRSHNSYYMREDLRKKNDNVPCPVCKQVYLRSNLKTHMRTHSGKRPHVCVICNKAFTTQWNLKLHRWTHMSRSSKPYKCTLCKGAFIRQSEYISHMNAHKSVRPYTCNYCGCQFIRKYNCQRHVREHEMAKKYVCKVPDCGKSFHRSYYLSEHMKVHSGARPFSCNICGKTSSNKSNHNKHVKIHHYAREPVATEA